MRVVLGLGNPGPEYRSTRHNVGFRVVDVLAERHGGTFDPRGSMARLAWTAEVRLADGPVVLAKPRTFMNRAGRAALALCRRFDAKPVDLLVVHDDADLAFGRVRVRPEGRAGGHNGIRSILEVLGTGAFPRVKVGVRGSARPASELADYVLTGFDRHERAALADLLSRAADAVEVAIDVGIVAAMRRFNGLPPVGEPPEP